AGYLAASVVLWWHVWSGDPASVTTCGCGDAARFVWFFEWPVYAIGHGHSLWYSTWLFHPTGINLLDDTSVLALGVLVAPVTAAFGPVAGMNVALTLAPALSAMAAFALLRRWVRWWPAAVVGGALYGFSPFVVTELALNQLNIAFLAVPPLIVLVLDELLVRQRRSATGAGLVLALLFALEFFVSTEVLVIVGAFAVLGVALLVVAVGMQRPDVLRARFGHAAKGILVALGTTAVLLAYPLWFLLRGPAHLSGRIWSNGTAFAEYGTTLSSFWRPGGLGSLRALSLRFGGYQGPVLPGLGYLGVGALVVALLGLLAWHRDRRLVFFASLGLAAAGLSLAPGHGYFVPWQALRHLPLVGNVVEARFTVVLVLCVAVMVALTLDHARASAPSGHGRRLVLLALGALALVPTLVVLWPNVPLTTRTVELPPWFREVGSRLPPGEVLLVYPVPFSGLQSSQAWQAVGGMRWAQAGGGGPTGQADRAGRARPGFEVLLAASLALGRPPAPTPARIRAVREALAFWEVTMVVVPDQGSLPPYERGRPTAYAVGLMSAAVGRSPARSHGAWVWSLRPGPLATVASAGSRPGP
ncbi:MAG TPA: hypothetical protein VKW77_09500, partial [Acidimicrobiales bacterium]|nr:hypothetical protein [Acidimicrobiales bacterium]